jgi:hypothetical protein
MTTLETLKAARKKITPRKSWIKKALAEDSRGADVDAWQPEACRWCSAGALLAVCGNWNWEYDAAVQALEYRMGVISRFNDTHTHKEVLAAFDEAIAKLEAA